MHPLNLKINKIIVYARPWNKDQFKDLAANISNNNDITVISEHKSVDESGLSYEFYNELSNYSNEAAIDGLSDEEIIDIIQRCRLLRSINKVKARSMIHAAQKTINKILINKSPDLVLSVTIDSYIIHLIYINCIKLNIKFVGLIPSFVNNYFRITALGERTQSRVASQDEIEQIQKKLLDRDYKPAFLANSKYRLIKKSIISWVKNTIKPFWFFAKRSFSGDILNYHYYASQIVSKKYWTVFPQLYSGITPTSRDDLISSSTCKKLIFLPLQMSPEATIDYWTTDISWIDYENKILNLLDKLSDCAIFAVKEHPNVLGCRSVGFYKRLAAHSSCRLINPACNSNELIDMCDGVLICTGTVGFEAALRGKPVFTDSNPFHLPTSITCKIQNISNNYFCILDEFKRQPNYSFSLIKHLLEGLLPGKFINDGSWQASNKEHIENNKIIGKNIVEFLRFNPNI